MEQASKTHQRRIEKAAWVIDKVVNRNGVQLYMAEMEEAAQALADAGLLADVERIRQAVRDGMHDDTCAVSTGSGDCDCWKDDLMRVLDGRD